MSHEREFENALLLLEEENRIAEGIALLEYLSDAGNVSALFCMARFYWEGLYVEQNNEKAVSYYEKAGLSGHPFAQLWMGNNFFFGTKSAVDYEKAVFWYHKAAEQNLPLACYHLALCYLYGYGTQPDRSKAMRYMIFAADNDVLEARIFLADIYRQRASDAESYLKKYLIQLETEYTEKMLYHPEVALKFADLYYNGEILEQDYEKAFRLYASPLLDNHKKAIFKRAECYFWGRGVPQDVIRSKELYSALAPSYPMARIRLAQIEKEEKT